MVYFGQNYFSWSADQKSVKKLPHDTLCYTKSMHVPDSISKNCINSYSPIDQNNSCANSVDPDETASNKPSGSTQFAILFLIFDLHFHLQLMDVSKVQ